MSSRKYVMVQVDDDRKEQYKTAIEAQGESMSGFLVACIDAAILAHRHGKKVLVPIEFATAPAKKK